MQDRDIDIGKLTVNWTSAQPVVAAYISSLVPDKHKADDILQNVALVIVQKYPEYDESHPFDAWAIRIARYEILMVRRKYARDRHTFSDELLDRITEEYSDKASELNEMNRALDHCISLIQPKWRKILELRYSMGLDVKGVAKQLGLNVNTALNALYRIRKTLRECVLRRLGVTEL
ncbi:sigma-70 family RNA polymerase sigma factor [Planctomycetota bacterium]